MRHLYVSQLDGDEYILNTIQLLDLIPNIGVEFDQI